MSTWIIKAEKLLKKNSINYDGNRDNDNGNIQNNYTNINDHSLIDQILTEHLLC